MTVPVEHLREFIDQMLQDAREHFDLMPVDQLKIDAVVDAEQLNLKTVYGMQQLRRLAAATSSRWWQCPDAGSKQFVR